MKRNYQREPMTQILNLRGKGYDDYVYWAGWLSGVEIIADQSTGGTTTTGYDVDPNDWNYYDNTFGGNGGGSGYYGGGSDTAGSGSLPLSDAYYQAVAQQAYQDSLAKGHVFEVQKNENGVLQACTTAGNMAFQFGGIPFDLASVLQNVAPVAKSIGKALGGAGLIVGGADVFFAVTDGNVSAGDVCNAVSLGLGIVGYALMFFPPTALAGLAITGISIVVGVVGTTVNAANHNY